MQHDIQLVNLIPNDHGLTLTREPPITVYNSWVPEGCVVNIPSKTLHKMACKDTNKRYRAHVYTDPIGKYVLVDDDSIPVSNYCALYFPTGYEPTLETYQHMKQHMPKHKSCTIL